MELLLIAMSIAVALVVKAVREDGKEKPVRVEVPADKRRKGRR